MTVEKTLDACFRRHDGNPAQFIRHPSDKFDWIELERTNCGPKGEAHGWAQ